MNAPTPDERDLFLYDAANDRARCVATLDREELVTALVEGHEVLDGAAFTALVRARVETAIVQLIAELARWN